MELMKLYWLSNISKTISDRALSINEHILLKMNTILDFMIMRQEREYSEKDMLKAKQEIEDWKAHIEQIL